VSFAVTKIRIGLIIYARGVKNLVLPSVKNAQTKLVIIVQIVCVILQVVVVGIAIVLLSRDQFIVVLVAALVIICVNCHW
jgi:hypothetical protein